MVIIFVETGLLFPFLPGDTLLFTAGMVAAQASTPVDIWTLTPCTAWRRCSARSARTYRVALRAPSVFRKDDSRFFRSAT